MDCDGNASRTQKNDQLNVATQFLLGILENILGKVLAAFQGRMSDLLGVTACKALSEDSALAVQMAAEPCAPQAGTASFD